MAQISLTFPDGNARSFEAGVTPADVAADISKSLAKKAISASVDGKHWDLQWPIESDAQIAINTMKDAAPALELIRHDLAHIMARAVQEIWPDVKVTIGPVIENGWYYDFDRQEPFTPEDLGEIEKKMREIINSRDPVRTEVWERARAVKHYEDNGEPYKVELIEAIPGDEPLRMYWHGDWQDLCRGPHLQHTGQVPADGFKLMSEILMEELPRCRSGVLSGPNLAAEIVNRELTATVIAAKDPEVRRTVQDLLGCEYFRVYANVDVYGVELAGALKNIYAIVAGLASALEMGENARAMLITRGLAEMSRFAVSLGANPMTFMGLAGVGDLIATCTSNKSRNYRIGYAVGKGKQLDEAVKELGQVAEGIYTLKLVREKSESIGIYMPLVRGLYEILYNDASINAVISSLMMAVQNSDVEFILPRTITQ